MVRGRRYFISKLCVVAIGTMVMPWAFAEEVVVEYEVPSPSGGAGYPVVPPQTGTATVDVDLSDLPEAPQVSSGAESPGPATPAASLTITAMAQLPTLDGAEHKPPDTHIAVGTGVGAAGRVVEVTNTGIDIWDKTGSSVVTADDLDAFVTALGGTIVSGGFDPKVIFDQHSGRFFIIILDGKTAAASVVHICTSKDSVPSTITSTEWTVESASAVTSFVGGSSWFDYPGIGVDSTRLVVTGNMFTTGGTFVGQKIRVFLKSSLTDNGTPAGETFNDIDTDDTVTAGIGTVQPAHVFGSTLNGDFYLVNRFGSTLYRLWQVTGAGGSASLVTSSPSLHGWTAGASLGAGAPQTNDGSNDEPTIATLSPRIQNAVYRDDGGNTDSIWLCLSSDIDSDSQTEVVWFEIDPNSTNSAVAGTQTTPTTNDSGSIDGTTAGDWAYMPAISVNGSGDACINFCQSSSSTAVSMRVATRHSSDPAGTFQTPVLIATGAGEYDDFFTVSTERWGDYSATVVDPDDDETFWVANEICETAATGAGDDAVWGTRIAEMGSVIAVPVELSTFGVE